MAGDGFSRHGPAAQAGRHGSRLAAWWFSTPLYRLTLAGGVPPRLSRLPPPRAPGEPNRGRAIVAGQLVCAGTSFDSAHPDWMAEANPDVLVALHGFDWLDDLAALGTPDAQRAARALIAGWLQQAGDWHAGAWLPAILARRLMAWLTHARFIATGADDDPLSAPILASAARQTRHLARTAGTAPAGPDRLVAAAALIYAGLCGFGGHVARRGTRLLERELRLQVLLDGGHVSRSPAIQAHVLAVLSNVRALLQSAGSPLPDGLTASLERMALILRMLRHGDGTLALFNGTGVVRPAWLEAVLASTSTGAEIPSHAAQTGFARLSAGDTLVLADVGTPPSPPFDGDGHAGTLSFEMSCGRDRLIVNCGSRRDGEWRDIARTTAAHSTLVVEDTNSSELVPHGGIGRRPGAVVASVESSDGSHWLTASHDGYMPTFGLRHTRRLYLAAGGRDLRGEDTLSGPHHGNFVLRFHLHPTIRASLLHNAAAVLLRTPAGAAWRLQAGSGALALAESIHLAADGAPRRTEQIVLSGRHAEDESVVKWAFRRIDGA